MEHTPIPEFIAEIVLSKQKIEKAVLEVSGYANAHASRGI